MELAVKVKICSLIIYLLYSGFVFSQPNDFPHGQFNLNIKERPSAPYPRLDNYNPDLTEQGRGELHTVEVARHHIIPFSTIRKFYNLVAERNRLRQINGFLNTYSGNLFLYASSNGVNCGSLGFDILDAGNVGLAQANGTLTAGGNNNVLGFDTFEQFYSWLPGNLFVGPSGSFRSDDPGDGFESNSHVVVGAEHFAILSRINRNMELYISEHDDSLLGAISADLSKIANRKRIYDLNPDDWELVHGKYRLSNSNKSITYPDDIIIPSAECEIMKPTFMHLFTMLLIPEIIYSRSGNYKDEF